MHSLLLYTTLDDKGLLSISPLSTHPDELVIQARSSNPPRLFILSFFLIAEVVGNRG